MRSEKERLSKLPELDIEVLRERARKRNKRDPHALLEECSAIGGLAKVQAWLKRRGIRVLVSRVPGATFHDDHKLVELNANTSRKKQLVFILHECGHVLVGKRSRDERYGMGKLEKGERVTFHNIVDVVDEEFEAWARGKKLAKRLGIKIDEDTWRKAKTWALVSYIRWANKEHGYNDGTYNDMRDSPGIVSS